MMSPSIRADVFRDQQTLRTERLELVPLGPAHVDGLWASLQEPETRELTGTHTTFTREQIVSWLSSRADEHDRADWAILLDGVFIGEIVLNDLDVHNRSIGLRMSLAGPALFGHGYGTEALRAVVAHAFDDVGLHRISLEVFDINPRAKRVYEKCGFREEGVQREAFLWEGRRYDVVVMGMLASDPRGRRPGMTVA